MPQATVGRSLETGVLYDLKTEMHDQDGNAVNLPLNQSLTMQNIGSGEIRMFEATARPAMIAGLFPLELSPGKDRAVSLVDTKTIFVYSPFRKGTISVTGGL